MMKREELERLIVDASDGILSSEQIQELEVELQNHPDLFEDYRLIMNLPDVTNLYQTDSKPTQHKSAIRLIKQEIRDLSGTGESFEMVTLDWFRRYALAASIAIFAITSVFSMIQPQDTETDSELIAEEYFYPADENRTDSYVLYLEELAEE
ncbi:MAG: hypothetical protein GVY07_11000 [Bacteroidetes bacterium]|jgi:hypothetical protein|nr:hypothetical protein [Bacteroidota bacterium]